MMLHSPPLDSFREKADAQQTAAQLPADDDLLKQTAQARYDAHTAQKATPGGFKTAWSSSSRTWMELAAEVDRRGLRQPEATDFRSP